MSLQTINNGTFDNDGSAEKVRLAFEKAKQMFIEIYGVYPFELVGHNGKILKVNATEDGFELVALDGGGDMMGSNNGSDFTDPEMVRFNLGLGSAAIKNEGDFATSEQGVKADNALQSVQAGLGITIDVTDPNNPIIVNNETNDYVQSGTVDYANNKITFSLVGGGSFDVTYTGLRLVIDGFDTRKGSGNTDYTAHEVGDYCSGWDGDRWCAFKVSGLPISTESNRNYAVKGDIF